MGVSHELRSPLNAILGYAQLLEHDTSIPEARRESIGIIRRSGEHLTGLIEGLLDISKIEAGRIALYRDEARLPEFLGQIANMFRLQAEAKRLGFVFNLPAGTPAVVYTDERRLRQILINLLSNAIKFTNQGNVSLGIRWRGAIAEIVVADTGIGIGRADQDRVFEPFQRIDQARAPAMPGVGLGLTITKLLTQIMGGQITLVSQPGVGNQFTIRLMLSEVMQPRMAAQPARAIGGYAGLRRTVVVVDDNPVHRALLEDALVPLGFIVLTAENGEDCLLLAARSRPDLFLIDLAMPGMDGWELAARIRAMGHQAARIVIVSVNAGELRRPLEDGAHHDAVIPKPIDLPLLLDTIAARMGLSWTGLAMPEPAAMEMAAVGEPTALRPAQAAQPRDLALIGYVRGIRQRLDEIAAEDPPARRPSPPCVRWSPSSGSTSSWPSSTACRRRRRDDGGSAGRPGQRRIGGRLARHARDAQHGAEGRQLYGAAGPVGRGGTGAYGAGHAGHRADGCGHAQHGRLRGLRAPEAPAHERGRARRVHDRADRDRARRPRTGRWRPGLPDRSRWPRRSLSRGSASTSPMRG